MPTQSSNLIDHQLASNAMHIMKNLKFKEIFKN